MLSFFELADRPRVKRWLELSRKSGGAGREAVRNWLGLARKSRKCGHVRSGKIIPQIGSLCPEGVKASGMGREFGPEVIGAHQNLKSIYLLG